VKRSPLPRASIEQIQAWQTRSRDAAIARQHEGHGTTSRQRRQSRRRNDSTWRRDCLREWGNTCKIPDCPHLGDPVQVDHLIPRAHGGPSVVENGWPLCRTHHQQKTDHLLLIDPRWLTLRHRVWLRDNHYATWRHDGLVTGSRCRIFTDTAPGHGLYEGNPTA
jgi:hypothetical protein